MKLLKLTLTNFKGARYVEFEPQGNNASVYGTNASGKTTLFDALTWLLFDKGSDWGENFSPKVQDSNGEEVHNINNRVDGVFALEDGRVITLSKDQSENWVKKRGGLSESFAGNTTEYYIDCVPVKQAEYKAKIAEICPQEMGQILMQPLFFPQIMDWKSRRKILLDVCGDVTEYDVINSKDNLKEITRFLLMPGTNGQFYTVEECQKIADGKMRDLRHRLEELPARIDEAKRALIDVESGAIDVLENTLNLLNQDLQGAYNERAAALENGFEVELRRQLSEVKSQIAEGEARFLEQKNLRLMGDRKAINELTEKWQEVQLQKSGITANIGINRSKLSLLTAQRDQLAKKHAEISGEVWKGDTVCPTCKRELPQEEIEAAKARFNKDKSAALEEIRSRVERTCSKAMINELETQLEIDEHAYAALSADAEALNEKIQAMKDKIAPAEKESYKDTVEYQNFAEKISTIEAQIESGISVASPERNEIEVKIERISNDITNVQQKIMILKSNEIQKKRIAELEAEEKETCAALEDNEYCLYLCEEFLKAKVSMLEEKINDKFENVRFKLFHQQLNGGVKEVCEVMVPTESGTLVPFSKTNDAAKLNAGLEIIDTLSRFWGVSMPVVVDNAESVVKLKAITPQVVRLVVSGEDKTLRVEIERKA